MAVLVFDYVKCSGSGRCVKECPIDLLEIDQTARWCKPKDEEISNRTAMEEFYEKVSKKDRSDSKIAFDLRNCAECYRCQNCCSEQAVELMEE